MLEFKVNKFITLKLENEETDIYVNGVLFKQCKYVLLRKKIDELESLNEIGSVDELAETSVDDTAKNLDHLDHSLKNLFEKEKLEGFEIPPHVRFWVHCSVRHEAVWLNAET
ncbi:hypothetical protein LCGC14_0833680 [marine sediment metagenome]|uniref:Uncharacterized protein n=1 Tax=marine sediment metagenome TaxID=412755 RepID=A0A0F9RZZ2_9ZZZZ|nr:MAG: hypothetical protein Lokiarch_35400 [Candidatus Lokiarchaeum sp. GC14_75]HEC36948.1 hypothetical protein [bacterium]